MAKAIQVHMMTPSSAGQIHQMTWVEVGLKAAKGMVVETKGDSRPWTVLAAYSIPAEIDGLAKWTEVAHVTV
jgi:hypothetical protein